LEIPEFKFFLGPQPMFSQKKDKVPWRETLEALATRLEESALFRSSHFIMRGIFTQEVIFWALFWNFWLNFGLKPQKEQKRTSKFLQKAS
jgi:hypothetical protein